VIPPDSGVVAEGRAVPVAWSEVTAANAGRVTDVPVAVGDTVTEGAVLVQLEDDGASIELDSANAGLAAAQASTANAQAGVDQARAGVQQAQAAVDQAQAARRAADAGRDALPGAATNAQERQADAQVEQAEAGVAVAQAQLDAARAQVDAAEAGLAAAQADEGRAQAAVDAAALGVSQAAVTSPIAGTVVSIEPAVGDIVQPGGVVARVADLSGWRFETSDLSETSIARVREGAPATITIDGLPGTELAGTVESVGGYGSSQQGDIVFRVVVAPTGEVPEGLRWNMTVTIEIEGDAGS
jgi:HlyD family secretion protein